MRVPAFLLNIAYADSQIQITMRLLLKVMKLHICAIALE